MQELALGRVDNKPPFASRVIASRSEGPRPALLTAPSVTAELDGRPSSPVLQELCRCSLRGGEPRDAAGFPPIYGDDAARRVRTIETGVNERRATVYPYRVWPVSERR